MLEFIEPVDDEMIELSSSLNNNQIGKNIIHLPDDELSIDHGVVVLLFVPEYRGSCDERPVDDKEQIRSIRKSFYELYLGNWKHELVDLGTLRPGSKLSDTYFALRKVTAELLKNGAIPLIIGGSQDLTYHQYRAFDELEQMTNVVSIDHCFDLGDSKMPLDNHNYLSHLIVNKPYNLFNYTVLGYQTYYNDHDEIDLLDKLFFETYRLGEIIDDLKEVEPVIRDANLVTVDCNNLMSSSNMPNGFTSREICQLTRYAGISENIKSMGIYEINKANNTLFNNLIAQMMWYFIEGNNYQMKERIQINNPDLTKFIVPVDKEDLIFYYSELSNRWWIEIPSMNSNTDKLAQNTLLACSKGDYLDACDQKLPERWYKAKRKNLI